MAKAKKSNKFEPEFKYESLTGTFTDYRGNEREFTMVAVSIPVTGLVTTSSEDLDDMFIDDIEKKLSVGVSVKCVRDKYNEDLGVKIAYGKAVKLQDHCWFVGHPGMINTAVAKVILEQQAMFFKKNPGLYLKGYNSDKEKYEQSGNVRIAPAEMTAEEMCNVAEIAPDEAYNDEVNYSSVNPDETRQPATNIQNLTEKLMSEV